MEKILKNHRKILMHDQLGKIYEIVLQTDLEKLVNDYLVNINKLQ